MKCRQMIANASGGLAIAALLIFLPQSVHAATIQQDAGSTPSLWPLTLAMVTASFAIERVVEFLWNYLEWILLNSKRVTATTLTSSAYVQFKSGTSVLMGAIFGVLLASLFTLHLFAALQPLTLGFLSGVPANWDIVLSGIVVGVLTKPIHDLIGILASLKGFLSAAALHQREAAGAAMADGVLKLAQSDAQGMIEVPGIGTTHISDRYGVEEPEGSIDDRNATDRYIDILHHRTSG